jgi:hypothetical protein
LSDKPEPLSPKRAYEPLVDPIVIHRPSHGIDPRKQSGIGNDASAPDHVEKFMLSDNAVAVFDQVRQKVEDLRFELYQRVASPQLAAVKIENMTVERQGHAMPRQPRWLPPSTKIC